VHLRMEWRTECILSCSTVWLGYFTGRIKQYPEGSMERKKRYCGKPGLNGGYFANPKLKFGVNCYGVKPKGKTASKLKTPYCPPVNFCKLNANFEASHKLDTDEISPFNNDKWSQGI